LFNTQIVFEKIQYSSWTRSRIIYPHDLRSRNCYFLLTLVFFNFKGFTSNSHIIIVWYGLYIVNLASLFPKLSSPYILKFPYLFYNLLSRSRFNLTFQKYLYYQHLHLNWIDVFKSRARFSMIIFILNLILFWKLLYLYGWNFLIRQENLTHYYDTDKLKTQTFSVHSCITQWHNCMVMALQYVTMDLSGRELLNCLFN
jgi:hypothetical protein